MKKTAYLLTPNGAYLRFIYRLNRGVHLHFKEEPLSKNGMNIKRKMSFQNEVIMQLKEQNKRGFLSSTKLCVDIHVHTIAQNPPHIDKIPKNYLDLLSKPISKSINRKKIVFEDDKQVKYLNIHYFIDKDSEPSITIYIYPLICLIEDIKLARAFKNGEIKSENNYSNYSLSNEEEDYSLKFRDSLSKYHDFTGRKKINTDVDKLMEYIYLHSIQDNFLKAQEKYSLYLYELLSLEDSSKYTTNKDKCLLLYDQYASIKLLSKQTLNYFLFSPMNISLPPLPTRHNQSIDFIEAVRNSMLRYLKEYWYLDPLLIPVYIKVYYKAPALIDFYKDLDNIMRIIVPIFHEVFKPPVVATLFKDHNNASYGKQLLDDIPKSIQTQITGYEIVEIPRTIEDTSNGYIQIILCSQFSKNLIDKTIAEIHDGYEKATKY